MHNVTKVLPGRSLNAFQDRSGIDFENSAKAHKFVDIEASLAPFDATDEGLVLAICRAEVRLSQHEFLAAGNQTFDYLNIRVFER